jgi:hypothetical protein
MILGVTVDLDKDTVPWQMCFTLGGGGHLRLESYIQVNMTVLKKL